MLRFDNAVNAGGGDRVASVALENPALHAIDNLYELHGVRGNAQHVVRMGFEAAFGSLWQRHIGGLHRFCQDCVDGNSKIAKWRIFQASSDSAVGVLKRKRE